MRTRRFEHDGLVESSGVSPSGAGSGRKNHGAEEMSTPGKYGLSVLQDIGSSGECTSMAFSW